MLNRFDGLKKASKLMALTGIAVAFLAFQHVGLASEPASSAPGTAIMSVGRVSSLLEKLRTKIGESVDEFDLVSGNITELEERLEDHEEVIADLRMQLEMMQTRLRGSRLKIRSIEKQIAERTNEIDLIDEKIATNEEKLTALAESADRYMDLLYMRSQQSAIVPYGQTSLLNFILTDEGPSALSETAYLEAIQVAGESVLHEYREVRDQLQGERLGKAEKTGALLHLQKIADAERQSVRAHQDARARLLELTEGKQQLYEELLEESRSLQGEVLANIETLQFNYEYVKEQLAAAEESGQIEIFDDLLTLDAQANYIDGVLRWPVTPSNGISAFFQDGSYQARFGVSHNAVDIPVLQGTPVRAAAPGIAYKVRDNGFDYSYILLAHRNGMMTLYGHMFEIDIEEGQSVRAGQIIGLSGGVPGTKGAGWMTTGAHMHFEVFKDWKHVDPLEFLPLSYLPIDSVPDKYRSRIPEQTKIPRVVHSP